MAKGTTRVGAKKDTGIVQPRLGPLGWARWAWRSLISMRTALLLLLALAVAALPGSFLPQRSINATRTTGWIDAHPTIGPWLDRLGFFEVYASPWFAAIYLLLLISLVGCVLPRTRLHWRAMRATPPRAPARLERLPAHTQVQLPGEPEQLARSAADALRRRRFRTHQGSVETVSAERGYLKETGNLAFHYALVAVIIGVGIGHLWGWKGDVIVPEGQTFADTLGRFDTFSPGPLVNADNLPPFTLTLSTLDATFEDNVQGKGQFGSPRNFTAYVDYTPEPGEPSEQRTIEVNHPLEVGGGTVFLLGNGYAPTITVRSAGGEVLYAGATPFLAQDNNYKSVGAIKVAAATPAQLGFTGFFLPTATIDPQLGPISVFPQAVRPALVLSVFEGDLTPGGRPSSVYTLDTEEMSQLSDPSSGEALRIWLEPGQTYTLPGNRGTITFDSVSRFAGFSVRNDPGKWLTLGAALIALAGLIASLTARRRRIFVRTSPGDDPGTTLLTIGGLGKDDDDGMAELIEQLVHDLLASSGLADREHMTEGTR
ncbi:MAG: cytochrome c biogenesis protein ResB [Nostocoides sp.]